MAMTLPGATLRLKPWLPQPDQPQHRLGEAAGEHLEGDEHADGEALTSRGVAVHHGIGADDEDEQGHHLFHGVGQRVVGVADLAHGKARAQILGEIVAVAGIKLGFHLQALDGFEAGDVFGGEGLVARAEQELLVKAAAEQRCDDQAEDDDDAQHGQNHAGQEDAVVEHDAEEDQQERKIEDQRDGSAGNEFADGLDAVQAGGDHAGGAMLEVARRKLEQAVEHRRAQHGIDPVAGVQDQVLAHPGKQRGKNHEYGEPDADDDQRALGMVDDDLVDDDLGEQRRAQREQLDDQRGDQHVAPDALVLHQLRDEPVKAERCLAGQRPVWILEVFRF